MISLSSEWTDTKSRHARGWLFFDADCRFCTRIARFLAPVLRKRRLGVAPMQDPRVAALLGISRTELLREIRFILSDGRRFNGIEAILAVAQEVWWARPLTLLAKLPCVGTLLHFGYHWIARRRECSAECCLGLQAAGHARDA